MNFWLPRDQVVLLETAANLWASRRKANDFLTRFSSFELEGLTKHLMNEENICPIFLFSLSLNISLLFTLQGMKSIRVKLMRQMKEESERFRALKAQKEKEINTLKQQVSGLIALQ